MTETGIIYFIQPEEFIGTNCYKIGCSRNTSLERFKSGYGKKSRYIIIMECVNPFKLEHEIKEFFNKNFELFRGREYFKGDENYMIDMFLKIKKEHNIKYDNTNIIKNYERKIHIVNTYLDWAKYNKITDVLIIDVKKREGYIKFRGDIWQKIYNDNDVLCINTHRHNLSDFIHNNQTTTYMNIHNIEYEYESDKILNDVLEKCCSKTYKFYKLKYYQYVVSAIINNEDGFFIFNSLNITFTPSDNILHNKILTGECLGSRLVSFKNTNNIEIVDLLMNSLIKDKTIIQSYKKLVYSILVKQEENVIFYDFNECLLTTWIVYLLYTILGNSSYIYSNNYYEDKTEINKDKIRCVIIIKHKKMLYKQQINDFRKLGIKNFIIHNTYASNNIYDTCAFAKYIENNKEKILINKDEILWESLMTFNDNIFYKSHLLLSNFFIWCCTK
jgi:hypothetical protein